MHVSQKSKHNNTSFSKKNREQTEKRYVSMCISCGKILSILIFKLLSKVLNCTFVVFLLLLLLVKMKFATFFPKKSVLKSVGDE